MAFDAIKKLAEGVPDYLEVPVEAGLLDKATAIINGLGYDMEDAISIFLQRTIQTPHQSIDKARAEELIRGIANATLEDMATQPLLIPRRDVFGVELPDYAMPGFCSGSKLYFGSIEDIASFRRALYSDDRCKPEDMEFMRCCARTAGHLYRATDASSLPRWCSGLQAQWTGGHRRILSDGSRHCGINQSAGRC